MSVKNEINHNPEWRVHTSNLLMEILNNPGAGALAVPINILGKLLSKVGERAIELDDKELNKLMIQLSIYSVADPDSPDYNADVVEEYMSH